jgi:predicted  nucleic acid-binding Zn-ribbon protein
LPDDEHIVDEANIANHALALLRKIDERTERMADDLRDLKVRLSSVEANLAAMNSRMDRFEARLETDRTAARAVRSAGRMSRPGRSRMRSIVRRFKPRFAAAA